MSTLLMSLGVAALMGLAAIFEKLSLQQGSPVGVFTVRSWFVTTLLSGIFLYQNKWPEVTRYTLATWAWIIIPGILATTFILLYFKVLQQSLASQVIGIIAISPLFTFLYSYIFLGEPFNWKRLGGIILIIAGVVLVK